MDRSRRAALVAGVLYLVTFVSSIPAVLLLAPVLDDPGYVLGPGDDLRVTWGAVLDLVNAGACLGTAVVLFPVVRRYGEARALGFVTSRVMEAAIIVTGVVSLLAVVSMRQAGGAGGADARLAVAQALVVVRDWTFLLGPGLMAGVNALLLGSLMYTSRLVPRAIPLLGLVGAPLHLGAVVASVFGVNDQVSTVSLLAAAPIALWELSLGLWMTLRGLRGGSAPAVPPDAPGSAVPATR